jgi:heme b synthase
MGAHKPAGAAPRLIAWETTRTCYLKCRHCRASADCGTHEGELTTAEAESLIRNIASFAKPILILTGGEPMMRDDIFHLARFATDLGLRAVMSPCGGLITPETALKIKESGIKRISISLDGATVETHDAFRGVPGAFQSTLAGLGHARDAGIEFQINTTVTSVNRHELSDILQLAIDLGAAAFDPFLLVPTGRGREMADMELSPAEYERTLNWIYEKSLTVPIHFKPTCAPHYYRIFRQREAKAGRDVTPQTHGMAAMTKGCLGGQGFAFVSHRGIVQICGFLEVPCGDLRAENFDFHKIWESSPVFLQMRNPEAYRGRCGVCDYAEVCGGCRARAFAVSGDYMQEEPFCVYAPPASRKKELSDPNRPETPPD